MGTAGGGTGVAVPWREPSQARSRRRVAAMLEAAATQLAERGVDRLSLAQVAEDAGVSIGSLYQFFPSREALLARILAGFNEGLDQAIPAAFDGVSDLDGFADASARLVEGVVAEVRGNPALAEAWRGVVAHKAVRHVDLEASRRHADLIFERLRPVVPETHSDGRVRTACFLICDLVGAASRTAMELPEDDGARLVSELTAMVRAYVVSFA